jgi:hypothetical protein
MRLSWRDGATTLLAGVVGVVYAAYTYGWSWPLVDTARGATLVIGSVGLLMCIVGGSGSAIPSKSAFTIVASTLGGAALLLVVIGALTGWSLITTLVAAVTLLLWTASTVHHATAGSPAPRTA